MLLGQVLEPIVVEIASEPDGSQDEDRPVVHTRPATVGAGGPIDVLGDGLKEFVPQLRLTVDVLEGFEDGDDLVAAVGVEPDIGDGRAIEPKLGIEGDSHQVAPRRFPLSEPGIGGSPGILTRRDCNLRGGFLPGTAEIADPNAFSHGH